MIKIRLRVISLFIILTLILLTCNNNPINPIIEDQKTFETKNNNAVVPGNCDCTLINESEAKYLAMYLSNEITPPVDLTRKVGYELCAIRTTYGNQITNLNKIFFHMHSHHHEFIVYFDEATFQQASSNNYQDWDDLNVEYSVSPEFHSCLGLFWCVMSYEGDYHPRKLAELYASLPGVIGSTHNALLGVNLNIIALQNESDINNIAYLFWQGWGDCPSGCIYSQYWYFTFENGYPVYIGTWNKEENPEKPDWWPL